MRTGKRQFTVIQGKKRKKKTSEKLVYFLLTGIIGLLLLQVGFSFARDALASVLTKTVISEDSVIEHTVTAKGILIRDESVVAAPLSGTVNWVVQEGDRLSAGTRVAAISSPGGTLQHVPTPSPGIVVLQLDGLEGVLQPKSLADTNVGEMMQYAGQERHRISSGDHVEQGTILFKVVNNFSWYFAVELAGQEYQDVETLATAGIRFSFSPEEEIRGRVVVRRETAQDTALVVFELKQQVTGFERERFAEAELVVRRTSGIILPGSALVSRGGETGVYILSKSVVRYRSVDVLETEGNRVIITGIPNGYQIITNPTLVREGMRL
ncbi:MAG: HlyD family efflux transporter periplasmic adaptor subunit [Bacillota bacterium]|nr:HlyD family efflux transporter periplasmic adaptor subunit [Bacillota bacterium]MDW7684001.1 HlyD family efflux transporter periplasmic adaptor subunit [Bacillota bacterium]